MCIDMYRGGTMSAEGIRTWALNPANGRYICGPEHPMPRDGSARGERWEHTNVKEVGECMDGCCADYKCQDCGHEWREELPE